MSIPCPRCAGKSRTIDSRQIDDYTRRRRKCPDCEYRWTTYETPLPQGLENLDMTSVLPDLQRLAELGKAGRATLREVMRALLVRQKVEEVNDL